MQTWVSFNWMEKRMDAPEMKGWEALCDNTQANETTAFDAVAIVAGTGVPRDESVTAPPRWLNAGRRRPATVSAWLPGDSGRGILGRTARATDWGVSTRRPDIFWLECGILWLLPALLPACRSLGDPAPAITRDYWQSGRPRNDHRGDEWRFDSRAARPSRRYACYNGRLFQ
jgi:hypothetical protein